MVVNATLLSFCRWESPIAGNMQNNDSEPDVANTAIYCTATLRIQRKKILILVLDLYKSSRESGIWSMWWIIITTKRDSTKRLSKTEGTNGPKRKLKENSSPSLWKIQLGSVYRGPWMPFQEASNSQGIFHRAQFLLVVNMD